MTEVVVLVSSVDHIQRFCLIVLLECARHENSVVKLGCINGDKRVLQTAGVVATRMYNISRTFTPILCGIYAGTQPYEI